MFGAVKGEVRDILTIIKTGNSGDTLHVSYLHSNHVRWLRQLKVVVRIKFEGVMITFPMNEGTSE